MQLTKRQNDIIQASTQIIAEDGIGHLTIKNLSAKIGVTEGAIYRHFKSKTEILSAMLASFETDTEELLEENTRPRLTSSEKIQHILMSRFRAFQENPYWAQILFAEEIFRDDPSLVKKVHSLVESHLKNVEQIMDEARSNNEISVSIPPMHQMMFIMGPVRLLIKRWCMTGFNFDLVEEGYQLIQSIKNIIFNNK